MTSPALDQFQSLPPERTVIGLHNLELCNQPVMQLQPLISLIHKFSHRHLLNSPRSFPQHSLNHFNLQHKIILNSKLVFSNLSHFTNNLKSALILFKINIMAIKHSTTKTRDENVLTLESNNNLTLALATTNNNTDKIKSLSLKQHSLRLLKRSIQS